MLESTNNGSIVTHLSSPDRSFVGKVVQLIHCVCGCVFFVFIYGCGNGNLSNIFFFFVLCVFYKIR